MRPPNKLSAVIKTSQKI